MGLFGRKKQVRFETITADRERSVFEALENKGYVLCTDPFQFDIEKSHQKLRKDAMSMAKDLHAELLVEVWDPIFQHMHWKGLKYAAWRKATPKEMEEKRKKMELASRPDYSDAMGSYDELQKKIEQKKLQVAQEDLQYFSDSVKVDESAPREKMSRPEDEMEMVTEDIEVVSSYDPYDHQGESQDLYSGNSTVDKEAASSGPMFDDGMALELNKVESTDPTKEIDPLQLMMDAADNAPQTPAETTSNTSPAPQPQGSVPPPPLALEGTPPAPELPPRKPQGEQEGS